MSSHMTSHGHMTVTWWLRVPLFMYSPVTSVRERFSCAMFVTATFTVNRLFHLPKFKRKTMVFTQQTRPHIEVDVTITWPGSGGLYRGVAYLLQLKWAAATQMHEKQMIVCLLKKNINFMTRIKMEPCKRPLS